ncbi:hypothetical protein [Arcobacter porcinus]|uniref:Lipoprotein n=1 Tax=Arcobacter porcinus TaxID=1935204 RepID=A0A5C2HBC8_9BACT|nr:hypothetical protein [Arcobacter porcinus]OCL91442.1 hypothetical protein AAX27_01389 [Aliarcobacter thereius]QEP40243.1 hypothetical protein APORC_0627 [Arcobacter porcinus]
MKKLLALTMAFIMFFSGCSTKTIQVKKWNEIDEKIIAFMLKEDDNSFVVIGEKYHYIFEPNEKFTYLLKNPKEPFILNIQDGYYRLDKKAFARFYVEIDKEKISKEFLIWAYENGAIKYKNKDEKESFRLQIIMEGEYYLSNLEVNNNIPKIDKEYHIKIQKQDLVDETVKSSPLKVVGQVVVIVAMIPIAIVIGVFAMLAMTLEKLR